MPTASLTSEQISIHAPRMGSDFFIRDISINEFAFQSTLPAWGATMERALLRPILLFQSTLPAWGATFLNMLKE